MQRHGISRQLQPTASGSTPHNHVAIPQVCSSLSLPPVTAGRIQISVRRRKSPDNLRRSTPHTAHSSAASPSRSLLDRLDPIQSAHPRRPNPHSARGTTYVPLRAVSFLGGFRTPAAELAASPLMRPASETLVWGARCQERFSFFTSLPSNSFVRPGGAILPPRPLVPRAVARSGGQGWPRLRGHRVSGA